MKKRILTMLAVLTVGAGMIAGCSQKQQQGTDTDMQSSEAAQEDDAGTEGEKQETAEEDVSELQGTLDEIKDFMFVITDKDQISYAFSFEEKPEGLEQVAVGDQVIVRYTGTISEVDPFEGEVLSVEKQ